VNDTPKPLDAFVAAAGEGARKMAEFARGLQLPDPGSLIAALWPDEEIEARRLEEAHPPCGRFVEVDGVRLHWIEQGTGRPVVFVHGAGGMVEDLLSSRFAPLVGASRRLIAIDRPGYGHSDRPRAELAGPAVQARLLHRALARLGIERPILIGHSWGGAVVMAYAEEFPADTAGVLVLAGWSHPAREAALWVAGLPAVPVIGGLMSRALIPALTPGLVRDIITQLFAPEPVPEQFARFPVALALRPSQLRANAEDLAALNGDVARLRTRYRQIAVPVEILTGGADKVVDPAAHAFRLARAVPNAGFQVLSGVGHMLHHTQPRAVLAALERLVARCPS
jgi:pimeloyl-ACP methyl ester carboxylesterase